MKKLINLFAAIILGNIVGIVVEEKINKQKMMKGLLVSNRNLISFRVSNQWVRVKQEGRNLSEYFVRAGYKKIAIYGMGYIGETLYNELKETKTKVLYGIDRNADTIYTNIDIISLDDQFPQVDAIVITVFDGFENISEKIQKKIECQIVSIVDVVYDV